MSMTRVEITHPVVDAIVAHARRDAPVECCGLLAGPPGRIVLAYPARNEEESEVSYLVAAEDHFAARHDARRRGFKILGAYHSHPHTVPVPSPADLARAYYPDFVYLIVSLRAAGSPELRAFQIAEGNSQPVELVIVRAEGWD